MRVFSSESGFFWACISCVSLLMPSAQFVSAAEYVAIPYCAPAWVIVNWFFARLAILSIFLRRCVFTCCMLFLCL